MGWPAGLLLLGVSGLLLGPAFQAGGETVVLEGVDEYRVVDAMFEAVRIVLTYRGAEYSPSYVQGVSGGAFRIAGPCPCAPTCSSAIFPNDLPALFGYESEYVNLADSMDYLEAATDRLITRIKDEILAGRPVVVWHAFTNAEFDVVCGFDEEKQEFIGRGSYAGALGEYARADWSRTRKCLDICPPLGAIFIGERTGELDAREAELDALEEAVRHAHSPRDRFLDELAGQEMPFRLREGLACFDAWANDFRRDPNKVPWAGDRYPLGIYHTTHRAAAAFLREIAPKYPEGSVRLLSAAEHFIAEADALDELHGKVFECWEGYKEPDPQKAARSVELLTAARDEYAKAMDDVLDAIAAIDPERRERARRSARIRREDGKVWIEGLQPLKYGRGRGNTFCGALTEALRVTEHPYTYSDLMGLSGLAFRVRWTNDETPTGWCPSAAIGEMPDEQARITKFTGWQTPTEWSPPEGRDNAALAAQIVAEIDAGRPMLAYPQTWNMAVIHGYEAGGKTALVDQYDDTALPSRVPVAEIGSMIIPLGDYTEPPALKESVIDSLRVAVYHWNRGRHHGGIRDREYFYGAAAFDAWIGDLQRYATATDEVRAGIRGLHGWNYVSLCDARQAAVGFLKDWRLTLDGDARAALEQAGALYEKEVETLKPLVDATEGAEDEDGALFAAHLDEAIAALTEARRIEGEAVEAIKACLTATCIDTTVPEGETVGTVGEPVLINAAVKAFSQITPTATHEVLVDGEVYVQHHVYLSAAYILMKAAGWQDADFNTLAAVSGAAALFGFEPGEFMPKYANVWIGMDQRIAEATGFGYEWVRFEDAEGAWKVVRESIDAGKPLLGWDWENLVIAGYRGADQPEDRLAFVMTDGPGTFGKWWTWDEFGDWVRKRSFNSVLRHTKRVEPADAKTVASLVIGDLVAWSEKPPDIVLGKYPKAAFGLAGMEAYAKACEDTETHADWNVCHGINPQTFIRNATAEYLKGVADAGLFDEETAGHIRAAAQEYRAAYEDWKDYYELLGHGATKAQQRDKQRRGQGAALIRSAAAHEQAAIELLKRMEEE